MSRNRRSKGKKRTSYTLYGVSVLDGLKRASSEELIYEMAADAMTKHSILGARAKGLCSYHCCFSGIGDEVGILVTPQYVLAGLRAEIENLVDIEGMFPPHPKWPSLKVVEPRQAEADGQDVGAVDDPKKEDRQPGTTNPAGNQHTEVADNQSE